jgi:hypothetical protein
MSPRDHLPPGWLTPEQEFQNQVFRAYNERRIDLDEAALQLKNLSLDRYRAMHHALRPSQRALFGKIARLRGERFPEGPDPNRHGDGGKAIIATLAREALREVRAHPRRWMGLVFLYYFAAEAEQTARAIVDWLLAHHQDRIAVSSPQDNDADDWVISAVTPSAVWSRKDINDWVTMIRDAPLGGKGGFCWWGGPV